MPRKSNSAYRMEVIRKDWGLCDVFEIRHESAPRGSKTGTQGLKDAKKDPVSLTHFVSTS